MESIEALNVTRFTETGRETREAHVARERPLTIVFNNQELVTLLCSPEDLKSLAVGFLASERLITSKDDIKNILVDERRGIVRLETRNGQTSAEELVFKRFITTGCGRGATFYSAADVQEENIINSRTTIAVAEVFVLTTAFLRHSQLYKETGGVHSAALCDTTQILVFADDIGRHNALDKIFGRCLLKELPVEGRIIISTGRITSEMLLKVAKRNIPLVISKSAPTDLGVKLAEKLGMTLIGFVRGRRMNVYTHEWRVTI